MGIAADGLYEPDPPVPPAPGSVLLDMDPVIPTGVPATPERVAALVVDPASPITQDIIPALVEEQQPTAEQLDAAVSAYLDAIPGEVA